MPSSFKSSIELISITLPCNLSFTAKPAPSSKNLACLEISNSKPVTFSVEVVEFVPMFPSVSLIKTPPNAIFVNFIVCNTDFDKE